MQTHPLKLRAYNIYKILQFMLIEEMILYFFVRNLTQKHSLCPREYRGKKIKVKNSLDFFACYIGGGV